MLQNRLDYEIGTIGRANQWTGFYTITASVMKELTQCLQEFRLPELDRRTIHEYFHRTIIRAGITCKKILL